MVYIGKPLNRVYIGGTNYLFINKKREKGEGEREEVVRRRGGRGRRDLRGRRRKKWTRRKRGRGAGRKKGKGRR